MGIEIIDEKERIHYVPKHEFRLLKIRVDRWQRTLNNYVTKIQLAALAKRVQSMSGFSKTMLSIKDNLTALNAENMALRNEMLAMRKRHDRLQERFRMFLNSRRIKNIDKILGDDDEE